MSDSTFNILSFDGGGIRGALSIKLLEKIQNETPNIVKKSNITIFSTSRADKIEFPYIIRNNHRTFFLYRYFKEKNNVNFNQNRERNLRYALQLQQLQSTGSTVYLQHVHPL